MNIKVILDFVKGGTILESFFISKEMYSSVMILNHVFFIIFTLDVKEDKERDPCIFIPHDKSSDVDPKRIQNQKKKVVAPGGVSSILQSATMVVNMAVKGFKKSDKPSVSISEKVSIADPSI